MLDFFTLRHFFGFGIGKMVRYFMYGSFCYPPQNHARGSITNLTMLFNLVKK